MELDVGHILNNFSQNTCAMGWRPAIFRLYNVEDQKKLRSFFEKGLIKSTHDTIFEQITGLIETRLPDRRLSREQLRSLGHEHLGDVPPHEYGSWIFFPWSGRLVHVLPEEEFRELRTSRNRNKITESEQEKLRGLRIGVVGLSVGNATAITLALEEVGGQYRLADFDYLELSNMNRLRTAVHNLGINKACFTAREIFEINPYADVKIFPDGITPSNIDEFLSAEGALDLLFDECDDLQIKILLRERAREAGIPVVMETSDRGMIDIERFDLEPDRPLLHGLVGDLSADGLGDLSTAEKIPIILRMIGSRTQSLRMAASLVDIETSIKTWPQLASAVALGGALTTDVARRIALGEFQGSGRYYVDIDELVSDAADGTVEVSPLEALQVSELAKKIEAPPVRRSVTEASAEQIRTLVEYGAMAPSGGNCQPWHFVWQDKVLEIRHDTERSASFLDFEDTASHLAIGAAAENVDRVAAAMGYWADIQPFPDGADRDCVCRIRLLSDENRGNAEGPEVIAQRATNRRLGPRRVLSEETVSALTTAARSHGGALRLVSRDAELLEIADILAQGDRLRFFSKIMHREMLSEVRWNPLEAEQTRDGIDVATLELSAGDLAGFRLVSSWQVMATAKKLGVGSGLEKPTRNAIAGASAVGLALYPEYCPETFFQGGRVVEAVWLSATAHDVAFQPMTALTYLFLRLRQGQGIGLSQDERYALEGLWERFAALFDFDDDLSPLMLFRIAKVEQPSARSLRRRVDDILTVK
jgi:molybdopterin/thiamine biosynthesis adenylyltransferase